MRGGGGPWSLEERSCDDLTVAVRLDEPVFASLDRIGSVEGPGCGDGSPRHIAIEAENYLALGLLVDVFEGRVDCIYIDPPYNTGSTDWKYNNRFVDASDGYRHSKWLSMMQRRLKLAERLLKPDGVLVITIDENEVHHLGVLLEQIFPTATHQMVTMVIIPAGNARVSFSRVEEHALFVFVDEERPVCELADDLLTGEASAGNQPPTEKRVRWSSLLRSGNNSRPQDRPGLVYPGVCGPRHRADRGHGSHTQRNEPKQDTQQATRRRWTVSNLLRRLRPNRGLSRCGPGIVRAHWRRGDLPLPRLWRGSMQGTYRRRIAATVGRSLTCRNNRSRRSSQASSR